MLQTQKNRNKVNSNKDYYARFHRLTVWGVGLFFAFNQENFMNTPNDQKQEVTIETLPPLFDTKTLSTALGLTSAWAEHARWKGTGPNFIRVGGAVRYRREDVLQWLEKGTRSSTFSISK